MNDIRNYSVSELAKIAGISRRTIHYYDEIDLLKPKCVLKNGYRQYGTKELFRLQQILLYKNLGIDLTDIGRLLNEDGNLLEKLIAHKQSMVSKIKDYENIISTIDNTIRVIEGEVKMNDKALFKGFSDEEQKVYAAEAREQFGSIVDESMERWNSHSKERQQEILARGGNIVSRIAEGMDREPDSQETQLLVRDYHEYMQVFYDCTLDIFFGLSQHYLEDERFYKFYEDVKPGLPEYLSSAMEYYCMHAIDNNDG